MRGKKSRDPSGIEGKTTKVAKHANKIIAHLLSGMQVGAVAAILISMATGSNYQAVVVSLIALAVLMITWRV